MVLAREETSRFKWTLHREGERTLISINTSIIWSSDKTTEWRRVFVIDAEVLSHLENEKEREREITRFLLSLSFLTGTSITQSARRLFFPVTPCSLAIEKRAKLKTAERENEIRNLPKEIIFYPRHYSRPTKRFIRLIAFRDSYNSPIKSASFVLWLNGKFTRKSCKAWS